MICFCCGFNERSGVVTGIRDLKIKRFICERCFWNPHLFFEPKRMLPMTYTLKPLNRKRMKAVMNYNQTYF